MTMRLAIIADDLTGALDSSAPFVLAGLSVQVAIDLSGLDAAIASGADVVAVNTASRALEPDAAADRAGLAARRLLQARPGIVFKKIDSRLKGNVDTETARIADIYGYTGVVVAPAVPDQNRLVRDSLVQGHGVETALPIAPLFARLTPSVRIADAVAQADLDQIVASTDWSRRLAVGARGLAQSFAHHLGQQSGGSAFMPKSRTLFAFGSRDPITDDQTEQLRLRQAVATTLDAPDGLLLETPDRWPALVRCTGTVGPDSASVARRFGAGIARCVRDTEPDVLIMGGGDTALAALSALGITVVTPRGEIAAGMPWFEIVLADGRAMVCAVKSGGFGRPDVLLNLTDTRAGCDVGGHKQENHRAQR